MKTIFKTALVVIATTVVNSAFAQNALEKRNIQKATAVSSVKAQSVAKEDAAGMKATSVSERHEAENSQMMQLQPASLKETESNQSKTPAQMAKQPVKKEVIYQEKPAQKN